MNASVQCGGKGRGLVLWAPPSPLGEVGWVNGGRPFTPPSFLHLKQHDRPTPFIPKQKQKKERDEDGTKTCSLYVVRFLHLIGGRARERESERASGGWVLWRLRGRGPALIDH